jgi:probable rRNA maturation factor
MKRALKDLGFEEYEISVLLTDDNEIQKINKKWLQKDRPTDVISFSQLEGDKFPTKFIGDIVISLETAKLQADERKLTFDEELSRLLAHGILHLLGYDHIHGGRQAAKMRNLENRLVEIMGELEEIN